MSKKKAKLLLPALKCKMGDRTYIVTAFPMKEIASRIKRTDEVHESRQLADWIQRELKDEHARRIADYLVGDDTRLFNSLVLGVYGGDPEWSELSVSDPRSTLSLADEDRMVRTVGILTLSGSEKLFAIDGQHRVSGIKEALRDKPDLGEEEVSVVIIGHDNSPDGRKRTRRLFIKLNQTAKKVSDRDFVALSEDNGLAVITRMMIDESTLFRTDKPEAERLLSFSSSVTILESNENAVTSVLGLYQIVKALYPRGKASTRPGFARSWPSFNAVQLARPDALNDMYDMNVTYWKTLIETVAEYRAVFEGESKKSSTFRKPNRNHLLFRPVGQLAFAKATRNAMHAGRSMEDAVPELYRAVTPWLNDARWHHILWDPIGKKMLNSPTLAEGYLLQSVGLPVRPSVLTKLREVQKTQDQE